MKTDITPKSLVLCLCLQIAIGIVMMMALAPVTRAGLTGPYTNDFYTLHLWHMQDTSGTIPGVATNGVFEYDYATNPLVVPLLLSNTPGPSLVEGTPNTSYSLAGQPGPGIGPLFTAIGTNFGYALSISTTQYSAFFAPWDDIGGSDYPDPSYAETNNSCSFVNTNTGAFTWEALVCPNFNPLTDTADKNPEILCSDGPNSTGPNVYPYTERAVQFRFDNATPSSGEAELEFNGNISGAPNEIHDVEGYIPTTGPDAVAQGTWYHVAAAFTGTAPTNGDPPDVLTLYWTKFDPTRTNADVLTNFNYFFTITNTGQGTVFTLPYPSNSIVGGGPFAVGNSARLGSGDISGGWNGNIAEVRISDYYRHSNEFMFNNSVVPSPPLVTGPTTNNFVGYGQTLNLSLQVSGSQPYAYQWYQNALTMAGQTNSTLVLSNITYAANTETFYAIVTNGYGSATSAVATVTVGATFDALFNTGCGPSDNPLDQTAPGSVDPHWQLPVDPDTTAVIPEAIVWSDGGPLASGGGIVPDNGASVWIGPHENSGSVAGTYTYQTTFQVDETVVSTNTVISGTVGASGAPTGTTLQMFLNGVETDVSLSVNPTENIFPFSITNGLQPGSNTLVCSVNQSGVYDNGFNLNILSDTGYALTNAPAITNQPVGVTNVYGSAVSFSAVALGAPPLTYYWLSNGVTITQPVWVGTALPDLNFVTTNFSPSQVIGTNYIANYQVVFSNFVGSVTSAVATLDVQIPPLTLVSAGVPIWNPTNDETTIVVYFSSAVNPVTATTADNYSLNGGTGGVSVLSAALGSAPGEIILTTTAPLSPTSVYTLTVQGVNSAYGVAMNSSPALIAVGTYPTTVALWAKAGTGVSTDSGGVYGWADLSGNGNNLYNNDAFPYEPQLTTNASGYPVIQFEATNETYLQANDAPSLEITSNMSVFAVMSFQTYAGNTNGFIVSKTSSSGTSVPAPYSYNANSSAIEFSRGNGSTSVSVPSAKLPSLGVTHILDVVMQGTNVTHRLDGNTNGTGSLSTPITDNGFPLYIGTDYSQINRLSGGITELILIGQALSSNEVVLVENYLAGEYNLSTVSSGPPELSLSPAASLTLYAGVNYTYTVGALGTSPFYYQWSINGVGLPNATNASYTVTVPPGSNTVSCTVSNAYSGYSVASASSTLVGIAAPTNAFSQMILNNGPFAYWRLNEPAGSAIAYDYVGGYNGSYGSSTTNGLPGVPFIGSSSELGAAMDNTASTAANGSVTTPGINLNTNNVTFLCWVFPFTNQFNPSGLVFSRTGSNPVFGSQIGGNNALCYTWSNNPATYDYNSALSVTTNIWSMTALVITPSNAVLYVFNSANGSRSATSSVVNPPQSFVGGLFLGADPQATDRIFNGEMDEVALFNYTLSASQLQQLYDAAAGIVPVNTNPTNIVFSVTNNLLYLNWPSDHIGWQLQAQTNSLSVGISTNWVNVSGSTGTNEVAIPINLTNGSVFYRLIYTP